jgi:single stranded DNA-binding protein
MNTTCIDGHLTKDPETFAPTGSDYTAIKFSIANNDQRKKNDKGEYENIVSFFDCCYWTKKPKYWLEKMVKGCYIAVEAELHQERWDNKEGQLRSKVVLNLRKFPSVKPKTGHTQSTQQAPSPDDEIPF